MRHLKYDPETNRLLDDEGTPYIEIDPDGWMSRSYKEEIVKMFVDYERLHSALEKIASMMKDGDVDAEADGTEVELTIDEAFSTASNCIDIARVALGRGEDE